MTLTIMRVCPCSRHDEGV